VKELRATAWATVAAALEQALELLHDVGGYPGWYPDVVRKVEVLEEDSSGRPRRARAQLRAALGPVNRDFDLVLDVRRDGGTVSLVRVPHEPTDAERFEVIWQVAEEGAGSRIDLRLQAALDVPRFMPVASLGDGLASGFVRAAARALGGA